MSAPDRILFDLDNTLYSARYGLEERVSRRIRTFLARHFGISEEEAWKKRKACIKTYGTTLEWLVTEEGFRDVESYFAFIHPGDEAEGLIPEPGLREFLEGLRLPLAILTNSPEEHAGRILKKLGIEDLFDPVVDIRRNNFSGKPRPEVYLRTLKLLGAAPGKTLFVDDNPSYTEGFLKIGGMALLLDEFDAHREYPFPRIRKLPELTAFIRAEGE
ncbi:MAG: HAD-IA family hydrolase [Treponema sp.]|jgi:pyrimidine 5'-nucleotidase|nr:HAD-IA family hydrolase [Treponema sp.]